MKINGRAIAEEMYEGLKIRTAKLKEQGIVPHIAVIWVGDNPASEAFIEQKKKWSQYINAKFSLVHYPLKISNEKVLQAVKHLNTDSDIHGIIVQRPLPPQINKESIVNAISKEKDIDGFKINSPFTVPVTAAVVTVLEKIFTFALLKNGLKLNNSDSPKFLDWLQSNSIVILGKGETAGGPIIRHMQKLGLKPEVITSKTNNPELLIKQAEIVISAVGKEEVIKPEYLKQNAIVLGVGMYKGEDDKLHGDYISNNIKERAAYYTPVTGGIGPINVAHLLTNLVTAAEHQLITHNS